MSDVGHNEEVTAIIDDNVVINDHGAKITLLYPTQVNGERISSVTMRRAKYRDQKAIMGKESDEAIDILFVNLTQLPLETIMEFDPIDIKRMEKVVMYFLGMGAG